MLPTSRPRSLIAVASSLLVLIGCGGGGGDDRPREEVSGTVTLDGQPLKEGTIQLIPDPPDQGTEVVAAIRDGTFQIPRVQGPTPGTYKVAISSTTGGTTPGLAADAMPGEPVPAPRQVIPPQFNAKTTLGAEVKKGGPNKFAYALRK